VKDFMIRQLPFSLYQHLFMSVSKLHSCDGCFVAYCVGYDEKS